MNPDDAHGLVGRPIVFIEDGVVKNGANPPAAEAAAELAPLMLTAQS